MALDRWFRWSVRAAGRGARPRSVSSAFDSQTVEVRFAAASHRGLYTDDEPGLRHKIRC